jgi:hypothetical protein
LDFFLFEVVGFRRSFRSSHDAAALSMHAAVLFASLLCSLCHFHSRGRVEETIPIASTSSETRSERAPQRREPKEARTRASVAVLSSVAPFPPASAMIGRKKRPMLLASRPLFLPSNCSAAAREANERPRTTTRA